MIVEAAGRVANTGRGDAINPNWVRYVLNARGIQCPRLTDLTALLRGLTDQERENFRCKVHRLHTGTDSAEDMNDVVVVLNAKTRESALHLEPPEPGGAATGLVDRPPAIRHGQEPTATQQRKYERSHHVYASSGAAAFEPVAVPSEKAAHEVTHTIQIEVAKGVSARRYDWEHKIIFRLTLRELPLFAAVILGRCPFLVAGNHGPGNDKFLEMRDQPDKGSVMLVLKQGRRVIGVPIAAEEIFALGSMAIMTLQRNAPHLDAAAVMQMVQRAGEMYSLSVGGGK